MILIVDNYDSFTYNLVHLLAPFGERTEVVRNDAVTPAAVLARRPRAVIISPGPCAPDSAGICLDLVPACLDAGVPLLGVCLGHQAIAQAHGARIVRAGRPMHGKVSGVLAEADPIFEGLAPRLEAARYHSLTVDPSSVPGSVEVLARAEDDGDIMALKVRGHPVYGVQFHPESYASPSGGRLLGNFLALCGERAAA